MIVDDDLKFSKQLFNNIIQKNRDIKLCNISTDGKEAISVIKTLDKADIVLLDLQLPKLNGIEILRQLREINNLPYIIVMSGDIGQLYKEKELLSIVYETISKPINYDRLVKIIEELNLEERQKLQREFVLQQLTNFEFNRNSKGFKYLVETLLLIIRFPKDINNIEKNVFTKVAKQYNTRPINIKWSIEKLIYSMYLNTDSKIICEFFNFYEERKPSIKYLVNTILDNYIEEYKEKEYEYEN